MSGSAPVPAKCVHPDCNWGTTYRVVPDNNGGTRPSRAVYTCSRHIHWAVRDDRASVVWVADRAGR